MNIPFIKSNTSINSSEALKDLINDPSKLFDKSYTSQCASYFEKLYPGYKALLLTSCTKAIELIAYSFEFQENDEVIIPSYTFVGIANSINNSGARLVFADLDVKTMNISIQSIKNSIGPNTKALVVMHYAGVACEMEEILRLCIENDIVLIEDNAQGIACKYKGKLLGGFGDFSCISFDTMKTISCGEGGVLLYKEKYHKQIIDVFNNGTNRSDFEKGNASCYEWTRKGSKYALSEYLAAILYPMLLDSETICNNRRNVWDEIYTRLESRPKLRAFLPKIKDKEHKGHIFYLNCRNIEERDSLIKALKKKGIVSSFHYTLLHLSKYALEKNFKANGISNAINAADCLIRLPIYNQMTLIEIEYLCESLDELIIN